MKTDTEYRASQKVSQSKWAQSTPHYWKEYRKNHPEKAERNRLLQAVRNRRAKARRIGAKMDASGLIAKMDASKPSDIKVAGRYWLVPVIAKMDALEVNIVVMS
jgi:predicted transposase YbfD/YdcC